MELPERAARALEAVRKDGAALRFEVVRMCEESRYRLSVRFRARDGGEVRLGLLYAEDKRALQELAARLELGGR